ncbi:hypothetical protein F-liban_354 [Faustovirus]|nr:hypothetical protein F-liban_354 [Faustovirus]SME65041.1 Hypothetical protein FSTVST1_344 [Faustovirus ST1]
MSKIEFSLFFDIINYILPDMSIEATKAHADIVRDVVLASQAHVKLTHCRRVKSFFEITGWIAFIIACVTLLIFGVATTVWLVSISDISAEIKPSEMQCGYKLLKYYDYTAVSKTLNDIGMFAWVMSKCALTGIITASYTVISLCVYDFYKDDEIHYTNIYNKHIGINIKSK